MRGTALVAHDGFSARYDLDRIAGVFSRPAHKLAGQSYVGRILVLDTAKGGVATAWMLHEMRSRGVAPLAIVFNSVNPILAQGAALGDLTMLAGFDVDVTGAVPERRAGRARSADEDAADRRRGAATRCARRCATRRARAALAHDIGDSARAHARSGRCGRADRERRRRRHAEPLPRWR